LSGLIAERKLYMPILKDFKTKNLSFEHHIFIYGATIYGRIALSVLKSRGFLEKYIKIIDMNLFGRNIDGIQVIHPDQILYEHEKDAIFLICAGRRFGSVINVLVKNGIYNIFHIKSLLSEANFADFSNEWDVFSASDMINEYTNAVNGYNKTYSENCISITQLGIMVTSRCNLRCKYCNQMAPYLQSHDYDTNEIIRTLELFTAGIDEIIFVDLIGGEVFLNKNMHKIAKWCCDCDKIKNVFITTNSTIIPTGENLECLRHDKIKIGLDDYGPLSVRLNELISLFKSSGIHYSIMKLDYWHDMNVIEKQNRSIDKLKDMYDDCIFSKNLVVYGNCISHCCNSYTIRLLNDAPELKNDGFLKFDEPNLPVENIRKKIFQFIHNFEYLKACDYCHGTGEDAIRVSVAEQL
jgi:nitrogen regulatory protein PII-like uncharacterized protein